MHSLHVSWDMQIAVLESFMKRDLEQSFRGRMYLILQFLRGRPVGPFIKRLQSCERLDPASFQRLTRAQLAETLRYAREKVPFYSIGPWREALAHADPLDVLSWPVLDRKTVITHREQLLARRFTPGLFYRHSSASTGEPLSVAYSPNAAAWSWANEYRAMLWFGVAPGSKTLMMWGGGHPLLDWLKNCRVFVTRSLTQQRLEEAAQYLLRHRPVLCMGLPSAIALLARYVRANHPGAPQSLVPFVKLGGEQVYPFQREEIAARLGATVIESYGCTEVGAIATECPAGSLHVFAEHVHIEILRDGVPVPAGEFGDIVATSLVNRAMPLVRCRIGDRGRLSAEPCGCGLPHPVLKDLVGRAADVFMAANGSTVHGSALGNGLRSFLSRAPLGAVGQVLFHQIDRSHWKVFVETGARFDEAVAAALRDVVRTTFGAECRVEIEPVTTVPREPSGKFRYYRPMAVATGPAVGTSGYFGGTAVRTSCAGGGLSVPERIA